MKSTNLKGIELKYNGQLWGADSIYVHYGIGDNWENVSECKMRKLKNCYKTELEVPKDGLVNFCFRDSVGNWDNNWGNNYCYSWKEPINYDNLEINVIVPKTTTAKPKTATKTVTKKTTTKLK